jgi:hypothetical protein
MSSTRYTINPRAVLQTMPDGSAVVLHLDTRFYFRLSETGTFLWQRLSASSGANPTALADSLLEAFDVESGQAELDAEQWLATMVAEQLVLVES